MTPHHQTFRGNEASDGAGLGARSHSTLRAGEIRQAAKELLIAMAVSMFCAVTVSAVVVGRMAWVSLNF